MACKIISSKRFSKKLSKLIAYLKAEWNNQVADDFAEKLFKRLDALSLQPFIGKPSTRKSNIRSLLITKHNRVFYKIDGTSIRIINMFDTRINPRKNPY